MIVRIKTAEGRAGTSRFIAMRRRHDGAWVPIREQRLTQQTAKRVCVDYAISKMNEAAVRTLLATDLAQQSLLESGRMARPSDVVLMRGQICEVDETGAVVLPLHPTMQVTIDIRGSLDGPTPRTISATARRRHAKSGGLTATVTWSSDDFLDAAAALLRVLCRDRDIATEWTVELGEVKSTAKAQHEP